MKKKVICKICGMEGHYAYKCYKKPKKVTIRGNESHSKPIPRVKMGDFACMDRKAIVKALDKKVSEICRNRGSLNGWNWCYTCGKQELVKNLDCGHFISRRFVGTRFDLDNVRPQCRTCNRVLHGNLDCYEQKLKRELGEDRFNELNEKKNYKPSTPELKMLLDSMMDKL